MRKGYQQLLERLRLMATPELASDLEWGSIQADNGSSWRCDRVRFEPPGSSINAIVLARVIEVCATTLDQLATALQRQPVVREVCLCMVQLDQLLAPALKTCSTAQSLSSPRTTRSAA